jgi:zinc D-Ala-D-Ala carboxypeptidase
MWRINLRRLFGFSLIVGTLLQVSASPAQAFDWPRKLSVGDKGRQVKQLQMRIAGWYPGRDKDRFGIDGSYGKQTALAVERFETHYGLGKPNGTARGETFKILEKLVDSDGSTEHFDWSEFKQHSNSGCSAQANAYAGTFNGGKVSPNRTRRYVRHLMWRLEALRAKSGGKPIGINSGFRSVTYNACIGGASASQHLYGTAADNRVSGISNRKARKIAKGSQFYGISCYSNTTHNHLDLRLENSALPTAQVWWWPKKDSLGRELDDFGRPCWGETGGSSSASLASVSRAVPGVGSLVPTVAEVRAFEEAGEPVDLGGAD